VLLKFLRKTQATEIFKIKVDEEKKANSKHCKKGSTNHNFSKIMNLLEINPLTTLFDSSTRSA